MCLFLAPSILQDSCIFNSASSRHWPIDFSKCSCCSQSCLAKLPFHFFSYSWVANPPWQFPPYSLLTTSLYSVQLTQNTNPRTHVPPFSAAISPFHFPPFHSHLFRFCSQQPSFLSDSALQMLPTETALFSNFPLTTTTSFAVVVASEQLNFGFDSSFPHIWAIWCLCTIASLHACPLYWTGAELSPNNHFRTTDWTNLDQLELCLPWQLDAWMESPLLILDLSLFNSFGLIHWWQ